jgi:glycosyltransferase involved in cell wall biosynthesis
MIEKKSPQSPRVSVVIPAFNAARFLPDALESVLSQEYRDFEVIVVDDGSTDETPQIVLQYRSRGVILHCQPNSGGGGKPRNVAVGLSKGELIAFLDADDVWCSGKLSRVVDFFNLSTNVGLVFTNSVIIDEKGYRASGTHLDSYEYFKKSRKYKVGENMYVIPRDSAYRALFFEQFITPSGVILHRAVFNDVGGFDESLRISEDRDLWWRIAKKYDIGYLDIIGHKYRISAGNMSSQGAKRGMDKIRAIYKQVAIGLPRDLRQQANRLISSNYFSIGYHHQILNQLNEARWNYIQSFKALPNLS